MKKFLNGAPGFREQDAQFVQFAYGYQQRKGWGAACGLIDQSSASLLE